MPFIHRNLKVKNNDIKDLDGFMRFGYDIEINGEFIKAVWEAVDEDAAWNELNNFIDKLEKEKKISKK